MVDLRQPAPARLLVAAKTTSFNLCDLGDDVREALMGLLRNVYGWPLSVSLEQVNKILVKTSEIIRLARSIEQKVDEVHLQLREAYQVGFVGGLTPEESLIDRQPESAKEPAS